MEVDATHTSAWMEVANDREKLAENKKRGPPTVQPENTEAQANAKAGSEVKDGAQTQTAT